MRKKSAQKKSAGEVRWFLTYMLVITVLGYMYLSPGTSLLLSQSQSAVLSDGTDPLSLPFQFSILDNVVKENPGHLFFGTVPTDQFNAPYGRGIWFSWARKALGVLLSPIFITEQRSIAIGWLLMIFNALSFYLMARFFDLPKWMAAGGGIAWAFNAFTRARAKVHMGFVGTYHLPLIFLGLLILKKKKGRSSTVLASICFLGAATVDHYHLVLTVILSPLFLVFYFWGEDLKTNGVDLGRKIAVAVIPAMLLLGWSFAKPVPAGFIKDGGSAMPSTGETLPGEVHPFLKRFAAKPIDYIAGDTGIGMKDLNPLKGMITTHLYKNIGNSNPHERANSIRWVLLILFGFALWWILDPDKRFVLHEARRLESFIFFSSFALLCFWVSLGSDFGLAKIVYNLFPQYRVSSRASVGAHFGVLVVSCLMLNQWMLAQGGPRASMNSKKKKKASGARDQGIKKYVPVLFPVLMVLELPPFLNPMPVTNLLPAVAGPAPNRIDNCGLGIPFPYVGEAIQTLRYYQLLQKLRRTDCQLMVNDPRHQLTQRLARSMAFHPQVFKMVRSNDEKYKSFVVNFLRCSQANFVHFEKEVPEVWQADLCRRMGWSPPSKNFCRGNGPAKPNYKDPIQCL